ncbi:hypothetical protein Rt10032_c08g3637 [Rhodotorula toruloides]|uniref:Uncharacterized protein n=1 Tax=Rhodotorula toruloides TaxID=5286 RepID=A0A511KGX0_RHOTO|nr:hypothetical protein Rt10032_c08g3637 [Rhodotorula toruloides]
MSSAILRLPDELLDLICGYVVELEHDGIATIIALLSTWRRFFPSARRALCLIPPELESFVAEPLFGIDTMCVDNDDDDNTEHLSLPFFEPRELHNLRHLVLRSVLIDLDDFQLLIKAALISNILT